MGCAGAFDWLEELWIEKCCLAAQKNVQPDKMMCSASRSDGWAEPTLPDKLIGL